MLCTGIPWLESKYKQYVVMRERVLTETQALRDRLLHAVPDLPQMQQQRNDAVGECLPKPLPSHASTYQHTPQDWLCSSLTLSTAIHCYSASMANFGPAGVAA